jgi:hypothetical protein
MLLQNNARRITIANEVLQDRLATLNFCIVICIIRGILCLQKSPQFISCINDPSSEAIKF